MRRKRRKWSTLTPGKWMGFSRLLPSILPSVCTCGSANIASKGVPGTLKPFLRTLKSVFSTFWRDDACERCFFMWNFENWKCTLNMTIWKSKFWSRHEAGFSILGPAELELEAWGSPKFDSMSKDRLWRGAGVSSTSWDIRPQDERVIADLHFNFSAKFRLLSHFKLSFYNNYQNWLFNLKFNFLGNLWWQIQFVVDRDFNPWLFQQMVGW